MRRAIALTGLVLVLTGCASVFQAPPPDVFATVVIEDDPFASRTVVRGIAARVPGSDQFLNPNRYFIRSSLPQGTAADSVVHQVFVETAYAGDGDNDDLRSYRSANGQDGRALGFVGHTAALRGRSVGVEYYDESFSVTVPHSALVEHQGSGYSIKVYAQRGHELVVAVTPAQIRAQLAAVDSLRARPRP